MNTKNQIVIISGIVLLLATATIAATNNVQIAKASFGDKVSGIAKDDPHLLGNHQNANPNFGKDVSSCAKAHGC